MKTRHNALFAFLATLVLLAGARFASADVQDNAGFFSEDAVRQANFDLKDIKQKYGKDLLVETHPTLPAEVQSQINAQNKDKVFADWAQQRGRDAKLDGVIVLITRETSHLQIGVGNKTQQKAFSLKDRDRLRDQMLTSFKQKQYDQGLLNAVGSYRQTLANNLGGSGSSTQVEKTSPGAAPTPAPSGRDSNASPSNNRGGGGISLWSLVIWGLVIFFVLLNIYESGRLKVFHLDAYRVSGADDFESIGFTELLDQRGVVVVEWADRVTALLPPDVIHVTIRTADESHREIEIVDPRVPS
jgi:uncharacterized membrane protein YgcG